MQQAIRQVVLVITGLCVLASLGGCGGPECSQDLDCDDVNACTLDSCDPDGKCAFVDDSNSCVDDNLCTDDSCVPDTGCVFTNNEVACDDADACTLGDTCGGGSCQPGPDTPNCDDGNPCTDDSCAPASGCVSTNNTVACDDGDACTVGDICGAGTCQPGQIALDCDDLNPCTDDGCDPATGCTHLDNVDSCDDSDACTEQDVCSNGSCEGVQLVCDDENLCTDNSCDSASGCVFSDNTVACDDADACTLGDICSAGSCQPGQDAPDCDDDNLCTDDDCDPATGCTHENNTNSCDDNDACTLGDVCAAGDCTPGTTPLDCDDSDACTQDGCEPSSGCTHDDISADCDDQLGCTRDSCDPVTGCVNQACSTYATCLDEVCTCDPGYQGDGFDCLPICDDGQCVAGEDAASCAADCDFDMVVVVEEALVAQLQASLDQYIADAADQGLRVYILEWTAGDEVDLRNLLIQQLAERAVEGAWLIGDLPVAWYQQMAFDEYEEFPFDLYLMDLDATFDDVDRDGIYDSHTIQRADIYVSRTDGTADELLAYFAKIHSFRVDGPALPTSAFNFMDDDWGAFSGTYGLEYMYTNLDIVSDAAESTTDAYLARLNGAGVEFVFQWIHSTASQMHIYGVGEGWIETAQVRAENHQAAFYNMFNCSAARFTEENLGMTYLSGTDYGLAITGTTKVGGMVLPRPFHSPLGDGQAWGPAFLEWYNDTGVTDDEWYLGMVILGDPQLTVSVDVAAKLFDQPDPFPADPKALRKVMQRIAKQSRNGSYLDYRATR
jgi:slime mold repeat-containing protein